MKRITLPALYILLLLQVARLNAQPPAEKNAALSGVSKQSAAAVTAFYGWYGQQPAWLTTVNRQHLEQLLAYVAQAPYLGLDPEDYRPAIAQALTNAEQEINLFAADMRITAAAIRFFSDVAYGRLAIPPVRFNGPPYQPNCHEDIGLQLAYYLNSGSFGSCLPAFEPVTPEYAAVKDKIALFCHAIADSGYKDIRVTGNRADTSNKSLVARLLQLNKTDSATVMTNQVLTEKLRAAQRMYNLLDDGSLRPSVLKALNIPLAVRLRELSQCLNQLRWLYCCRQQDPVIVVNIPSGNLVLYQQGKQVLISRVVTGKKSARTPTLCSRVTAVVLYPYWMVPRRIATRELLPHIQRDIGYLERNQFQVLDGKGRLVDPARISWESLTPGNFPYTLRQGTGCDNSLGIIKLEFYNPFNVYLHDTPWKSLFMLNQRFFSHGCIRVEEAVPLARLLLAPKSGTLDSLINAGEQSAPVPLKLQQPAWVFVLYNTAWPDEQGNVRFYEDIYNHAKRDIDTV